LLLLGHYFKDLLLQFHHKIISCFAV